MFFPAHWAAALIGSLEAEGAEPGEGVSAFGVFVSWVNSLPGAVFGNTAAAQVESLAREALSKTGTLNPAAETALRFTVLLVRKNRFRYAGAVISEAEKLLDKGRGVVRVSLEYALPPGEEFISRVKEALKRKTRASEVELEGRANPGLVGGYRLRVGDELIDATVLSQLRRLEAALGAGISGGISGSAVHPADGGK